MSKSGLPEHWGDKSLHLAKTQAIINNPQSNSDIRAGGSISFIIEHIRQNATNLAKFPDAYDLPAEQEAECKYATKFINDIVNTQLTAERERLVAALPDKRPTAAPRGQMMPFTESCANDGYNQALDTVKKLIQEGTV